MPKITLYIATSLDGFIADAHGGVDWLFHDADYGYAEFYAGVAALAMGRRTYDQTLGFGPWPWLGKPAWVFTGHSPAAGPPDVEFVQTDAAGFMQTVAPRYDGTIWLVGGANLAEQFRAAQLIDEYIISIHPILLGQGLPLFGGPAPPTCLQLDAVRRFDSGLAQLCYRASAG